VQARLDDVTRSLSQALARAHDPSQAESLERRLSLALDAEAQVPFVLHVLTALADQRSLAPTPPPNPLSLHSSSFSFCFYFF
jgi:hypothetical protein